jgi:hypothetical protein
VTRGDLHRVFRATLSRRRGLDGGFGFGGGEPSTPEPTAVAALALGDPRALAWLERHQRPDGGFATFPGPAEDVSPGTLAALALGPGRAGARALDAVLAERARTVGDSETARRGWGWTPETFSWIEPTARVLLAARVLRPAAGEIADEARGILAARQCREGGWNHGNEPLAWIERRPYLQTTAVALQALPRGDALVDRALRFVERGWPSERGGLSLAQTVVALRLHGRPTAELERALAHTYRESRFLGNGLTLAWAALATAPDARLERLGGVS